MDNIWNFWEKEKPSYNDKSDFITIGSIDSYILESDPDFVDYLFYHNILDKFCWLIKLHYADSKNVKGKKYRIDTLFQRYIHVNKIRIEKSKKCFKLPVKKEALEFYLTKGWHNELVRSDPLHPDYLDIGTYLSDWSGPGSGGMVAWNIVQSYYAFFEFFCCIACAIEPEINIEGHKRLAREFNNHIYGKIRNIFMFYPFILSSSTPKSYIPGHPKHCQYKYAAYPRDWKLGINELEYEIQKAFKLIGLGNRTSLIDLLYELRKWANYTGVPSLLKLSDGGYQRFLVKNLASIVFFCGGMAELTVIFALGEQAYLGILKNFSVAYIEKNERFAKNKFLIPAYIRLRSYKHLGILYSPIDFIVPEPADPVQFIELKKTM